MIDKQVASAAEAVADIPSGAVIHISGFGVAGAPIDLCNALAARSDVGDLTIVNNGTGGGNSGFAELVAQGRVRKIVCSFPRTRNERVAELIFKQHAVEIELTPQGTLAERIRAAGAGIGAFFTPTSAGTPLAEGKEVRTLDGVEQVLEYPLHADYALVRAFRADRWGNTAYRMAGRNFGPIMCMAAKTTIVQVSEIVPLGAMDPETIVTPSIFVHRVVHVPNPSLEG